MSQLMKQHLLAAALVGLLTLLAAAPASAQVDLSGNWALLDFQNSLKAGPGPFPNSFQGIPINKDGRDAALSFDNESLSELQRECEPWMVHYVIQGPFGFRITSVVDNHVSGEVVGWTISGEVYDRLATTIWVDGRAPPPPQALHTWGGYTTGVWRGDTLVSTTTHIKDGALERVGVPSSNQEVFRMFITRHADLLTITGIIHDPIYLTAPYALAQVFQSTTTADPSTPAMHCAPELEDTRLASGYQIAAYLPGQNPAVMYMPQHYGIPLAAAMGGAQTMYPEYRKVLQKEYKPPTKYCTQYCCERGYAGQAAVCKTRN
ncbi:MAG TPA: hypothetical protein VN660_06040 [Steroidobacteraceae bacterium]|nr:hypothetical protein [Steroidobacteraceae bacterium]